MQYIVRVVQSNRIQMCHKWIVHAMANVKSLVLENQRQLKLITSCQCKIATLDYIIRRLTECANMYI